MSGIARSPSSHPISKPFQLPQEPSHSFFPFICIRIKDALTSFFLDRGVAATPLTEPGFRLDQSSTAPPFVHPDLLFPNCSILS